MTTNRVVCPVCATSIFSWRGPANAKIVVIADEPVMSDKEKMVTLSGPAGWVLRNEFDRQNIDLFSCRIGYLYYHDMPTGKEGELCRNTSAEEAIKELNNPNRKAVFLMGSKCSKFFLNIGIDTVSSLRVTSSYIQCKHIIASISALNVLSGTVGELRLSVRNLKIMLDEIGVE